MSGTAIQFLTASASTDLQMVVDGSMSSMATPSVNCHLLSLEGQLTPRYMQVALLSKR
jgi:hypothetical protein